MENLHAENHNYGPLIGAILLGVVVGAILGYYLGYDSGFEKAAAQYIVPEAANSEETANPLQNIQTNPLDDVKFNPFE